MPKRLVGLFDASNASDEAIDSHAAALSKAIDQMIAPENQASAGTPSARSLANGPGRRELDRAPSGIVIAREQHREAKPK